VDRGGEGNLTKHVSGAETRRCAEPALGAGFPGLGGSYVVAILMTEIGPVTVVALGKDDAAGWGAHSCDPGQSCPPTKITRGSRWGKRISDRQQRACAASDTVWLPAGARICPP
jgi:hypothetical protein